MRVNVRPPAAVDAVVLSADAEWLGLLPGIWLHPTLEARAENTGTSSRPITITIDQPAQLIAADQVLTCTVGGGDHVHHHVRGRAGRVGRDRVRARPRPVAGEAGHPAARGARGRDPRHGERHEVVHLRHWAWPLPPGLLTPVPPPTSTAPGPVTGEQSTTSTPPAPDDADARGAGAGRTERDPGRAGADRRDAAVHAAGHRSRRPSPAERSEPSTTPPADPPAGGGGGLGGLLGWLLGG